MLDSIPGLDVRANVPLSGHTRFSIGGPAATYAETADEDSFIAAVRELRSGRQPYVVIGDGTNLVVADDGYAGVVLRLTASRLSAEGNRVYAEAGAELQSLVDFSIDRGLAGIHTMTGIPGSVGAAVYGNAGAYGNSISGAVVEVRFFDGERVRAFDNGACEFRYRESVFKRRKEWIILSAAFELRPGDAAELRTKADEIRAIRDRKYPPTMKCAGSIFKNLILSELPAAVQAQVPDRAIIEGKVPSAYFLEQVGAKGMTRGEIRVAEYHANLIYNAGGGTARELRDLIGELKRRVRERFGLELEEEVQYLGFSNGNR